MLLSHSSGLANFAFLEPDKRLHLHFPPGTGFAYSGEGLNLLQLVLEEKLSEQLDVAMQRDLFNPLGMNRTGMVWREEFAADTALRYDANGRYSDTTHEDHVRAAGSMATTIQALRDSPRHCSPTKFCSLPRRNRCLLHKSPSIPRSSSQL
jgi:CubicO group peptidase (beta-lactamase class C family)